MVTKGMYSKLALVIITMVFCGCCTSSETPSDDLRIAAFNIKVLGKTKMSQSDVVETLVKIIVQYDIILIQEIRDKKGTAIQKLLQEVKRTETNFDMVLSERLGRTRSKEQYAFFYRTDKQITVVDTYQYSDEQDVFEREPWSVKFNVPWLDVPDFVLVGIHVDPDVAVEEINSLYPAHNSIQSHWGCNNIIIMGDLNAGGSYVSKSKISQLTLRTTPGFYWLIPDSADTTVSNTDCAYDRFIVSGEELHGSVVNGSVAVFRFDDAYGMSQDEALLVSDHYPIELALQAHSDVSSGHSNSNSGILSSIRSAFARLKKRFEL